MNSILNYALSLVHGRRCYAISEACRRNITEDWRQYHLSEDRLDIYVFGTLRRQIAKAEALKNTRRHS